MPPQGVCPHLQGLPGKQVVEVVLHIILIRPLARVGRAPASAPFPGAWLRLVSPAHQRGHFQAHSQPGQYDVLRGDECRGDAELVNG